MSGSDPVTLQRLEGGKKWHCPGVECRYVSDADLSLSGATREVYWDGNRVRAGDDDPVTLAKVCNYCQTQLGWTNNEERFAAVRRQHGSTGRDDRRDRPTPPGEDS
ncbi:MAG: hypothetical protein V5A28_05525 [Haloarculaceae archaeon]